VQQGDELQQQTLQTLRAGPFNKIRMCVFPKSYEYNHNEAPFYPFERDAAGKHDFARPNPALFAHLEQAAAGNNAKNSGLEAQPAAYYLNASSLDPSAKVTEEILYYMDFHQPIFYQFSLPDGKFTAELIDPWERKVTSLPGTLSGETKLKLTGRPYQALRFRRIQ
jgi:hypothetical protein